MTLSRNRRIAVAIIALLAVAVAVVLVARTFSKPVPVPVAPGSVKVPTAGVEHAGLVESSSEDVVGILLLGSDRRPGSKAARGDAIMYALIDSKRRKMALISIPRDSYVSVPGQGKTKINSAFQGGSVKPMVKAVKDVVDLPVDYYAVAEFWDLRKVVNKMGGVVIERKTALIDGPSGAKIPAGTSRLDGKQALALARARYALGRQGDFGRTANQQSLVLATLEDKLWKDDGAKLSTYVKMFGREFDTNLPPHVALQLGSALSKMSRADVTNAVLPGKIDYAGRVSVVFLDKAKVKQITSKVRKDFGLD